MRRDIQSNGSKTASKLGLLNCFKKLNIDLHVCQFCFFPIDDKHTFILYGE